MRMDAFAPYVSSLEDLAGRALNRGMLDPSTEDFAAVLDGQPSAKLRDVVPVSLRRATGAFFTGAALAERALDPYIWTLSRSSIVFDPACGAGDLLLACARHLPGGPNLATTAARWGEQLYGLDIHPEFVRAAKARLVLAALSHSVSTDVVHPESPDKLFPGLRVSDGLAGMKTAEAASHIVLNPPYQRVPAPPGCKWGAGKVSLAAVFLDRCLAAAAPGARIIAILPDVLRTGSLYTRWRKTIEARAAVESVHAFGVFDAWADVDVFILHLVVGTSSSERVPWWSPPEQAAQRRVGDEFEVRVGPVVPHRDPEIGRWYPYVYPRLLPVWGTMDIGEAPRRRFKGRTFTPPLVTVRRTSAPSDRQRAVATIVTGDRPVTVENHLLVLQPHDNSLARCKELVNVLRDSRTNRWLNERIRCRHLTVAVLRDLPLWDDYNDR